MNYSILVTLLIKRIHKHYFKQYSTELGTEVSIDSFKMLILGQGIEVEEKDFVAEVAATANQ